MVFRTALEITFKLKKNLLQFITNQEPFFQLWEPDEEEAEVNQTEQRQQLWTTAEENVFDPR